MADEPIRLPVHGGCIACNTTRCKRRYYAAYSRCAPRHTLACPHPAHARAPIKTTAFPFFWIRFASPKAGALRLGCDKLWLAPRLSWPSLRSGFFQGARAFGFGCGAAPPGCGYPPSFLLAQKRGDPEPSPWVPGGKSPDAVTPEFWYVQNSGTPYNGSAPPESGGSRHTRDIQMLGYCCVSFVFLLGSTWRP